MERARRSQEMKHRKLGASNLQVSLVGLGCNNFGGRIDLEASRKVIDQAIESGITLFDTADIYGNAGGSEEILGQVLGDRRKDIVLATKFGMQMGDDATRKGASKKYIASRGRQPEAPPDGLDRPLPASSAGPGNPDRGDAPGSGRSR